MDEQDSFSAFAYDLCCSTYENSPFVDVLDFSHNNFRGPKGLRYKNLPEGFFIAAAPDGIGTKVALVDVVRSYENAAYDWVAMTCGDITRWGGLPLVLLNQLDTATLDKEGSVVNGCYRAMLLGLCRLANQENLVMLQGETSEVGLCAGSPNPHAFLKFLWAGTALGAYHPHKMITGETLAPGQVVVALREYGFRSNGISATRAAFAQKFGPDFWTNPEALPFLRFAAVPSKLYDHFLTLVHGWYSQAYKPMVSLHLVTHITGGGIPTKFGRDMLFPRGLSAILNDLWEPPLIMKQCAQWSGMTDQECYKAWNGGQGVLIVVDKKNLPRFLHLARMNNVEAKKCGEIFKNSTAVLEIVSKFSEDRVVVTFTP